MSVCDCVCVCYCVHVCVDLLMTLFVFTTCSFFHHLPRAGGDVCPLIGATATSTNKAFFCNGRDCATQHESYTTQKMADVRSLTMFFHVVATKKALTRCCLKYGKLWDPFIFGRTVLHMHGSGSKEGQEPAERWRWQKNSHA